VNRLFDEEAEHIWIFFLTRVIKVMIMCSIFLLWLYV